MKTLFLATAAALALSGPALADTTSDFALRHFAQSEESGDGALRIGNPTSTGNVAYAIEHFAQDREGGDGPRVLIPSGSDVTLSTSNSDLASFAAAKLHNDERGDN